MNVELRRLEQRDLDMVEEIERASYPTPWSRSMFAAELRNAPADLALTTTPPGATVNVNGANQPGSTPLSLRLAAGRHRITVEAPGYAPQVIELTVKPGERVERAIYLTTSAGTAALPPAAAEATVSSAGGQRSRAPGYVTLGIAGASAIDLARDVLARYQGFSRLIGAPATEVAAIRGLGPAKAATLSAAVEVVRRSLIEQAATGDALTSPQAVRDYLRLTLRARPYEVFVGIFLDSQNRLLAFEEMFRGTLAQTSVYPREVVKAALARNAAAVIFAHNHPSGVPEPSQPDEMVTRRLKQALDLVDIRVLDHVVIGGADAVSFSERGLL